MSRENIKPSLIPIAFTLGMAALVIYPFVKEYLETQSATSDSTSYPPPPPNPIILEGGGQNPEGIAICQPISEAFAPFELAELQKQAERLERENFLEVLISYPWQINVVPGALTQATPEGELRSYDLYFTGVPANTLQEAVQHLGRFRGWELLVGRSTVEQQLPPRIVFAEGMLWIQPSGEGGSGDGGDNRIQSTIPEEGVSFFSNGRQISILINAENPNWQNTLGSIGGY